MQAAPSLAIAIDTFWVGYDVAMPGIVAANTAAITGGANHTLTRAVRPAGLLDYEGAQERSLRTGVL